MNSLISLVLFGLLAIALIFFCSYKAHQEALKNKEHALLIHFLGIIPLIFLGKISENYFSNNTSLNGFVMSCVVVIPVALIGGLIYRGWLKVPLMAKKN